MYDITTLLKVVLHTPGVNGRMGLPVIFEGKPGNAKTSRVTAEAAGLGLDTITLIASLREPTDFAGFAVPERGAMRRYAEKWVLDAIEKGDCVVLLDELNTAPPSVQKALLRVVLEGVVGDKVLPDGVRFVAAQNSIDDAADGYELSAPLANRFGHIQWPAPTAEEWGQALNAGFSTDRNINVSVLENVEDLLAKKWEECYSRAAALVSGFIRQRSDLLNFKPSNSVQVASPRTWEMATRALAGCFVFNAGTEVRDTLVCAFVGEGPGTEFCAFLSNADLPDATKFLDGTISWSPNPRRDDVTFAVMQMCANVIKDSDATMRNKRIDTYMLLLNDMAKNGKKDIALVGLTFVNKLPGVDTYILSKPSNVDLLMSLNGVMNRV